MATRTEPINIRILQVEAKLKKLCNNKNKPENYIEHPPNEKADQRKVHRKEICISLLDENEGKKRLEKNVTATEKRRQMVQNIMVIPTSPPRSNIP